MGAAAMFCNRRDTMEAGVRRRGWIERAAGVSPALSGVLCALVAVLSALVLGLLLPDAPTSPRPLAA